MDEYVCPSCGAPARGQSACPACGTHLDSLPGLPRRSEFEAGGIGALEQERGRQAEQAAGAAGGILIRWVALIIDNVLAGLIGVIGGLTADLLGAASPTEVGIIVWLTAWMLYPPVSLILWDGRTVGKRAVGLQVRNADGERVTAGRALAREIVFKFGLGTFIPFGLLLSALFAIGTKHRLTLHDRATMTRVVTTR